MEYERIRTFIQAFGRDDEGLLGEIYRKAREAGIPVIRPEMRDFLRVLLYMEQPQRILEIGTAVGYSALLMAETGEKAEKTMAPPEEEDITGIRKKREIHIDTIELDPERVKEAEENICRAGREKEITVLQGDAAMVLDDLQKKTVEQCRGKSEKTTSGNRRDTVGTYDFVFIDAAKAQYSVYLEKTLSLCHAGTVIVTDNILQEGEVLESHFLVEKRNRTIHDRMREYLRTLKSDPRLETAILAVGDGAAVTVVKKPER